MRHEKIKHLDLFSGIGGFALAVEEVFGKKNVEHAFCDNEPFAQAILRKHWPNAPIYDDIKTLTADRIAADTEYRRCEQEQRERGIFATADGGGTDTASIRRDRDSSFDILTGGFPCQPFSAAGRRKGTEDNRHLWPQMLRVIRETNPAFVLGENVGGLLTWDGGLVLEMVLADLEGAGYEAGAFVIPACAVGAPHRRDRVWIAAHSRSRNAGRHARKYARTREEERLPERHQVGQPGVPSAVRDAGDAEHLGQYGAKNRKSGIEGSHRDATGAHQDEQPSGPAIPRAAHADAFDAGLEGIKPNQASGHGGQHHRSGRYEGGDWSKNWPEVAARLCTLDDGLPDGLARPRGWRNAALKGAGNAIVPQVAARVIKAMMEA